MLRRIRWRGVIVPALLGCCAALGCRSSVSTHVERGPLGFGWTTKKMAGVPVTVKMPTHLRVEVIEQRHLTSDGCFVADYQGRPLVGHRVKVEVQEKDQVFTVDSVRPGAGKLTYQAEFEDQYFKSLNTKVEDETIQKITAAINNFDPNPLKQPGKETAKGTAKADTAGGEPAKVQLVESTVAAAVFDLSDPEMECHLREFLRQHANACHECRQPFAPGSTVVPVFTPATK